jgi:hypothetical protein
MMNTGEPEEYAKVAFILLLLELEFVQSAKKKRKSAHDNNS